MSSTASLKGSGLEGVDAGNTAICSVEQGALIYRGYEIHDLAANATFEEVAYLLLMGEKPSASELTSFKAELDESRDLPRAVEDYMMSIKGEIASHHAEPMDVLRTCVSILGNMDEDSQAIDHASNLRKAKRLTARIPTIIGHMQNVIDGRELVRPDASLSHAGNLLYMITGEKPTEEAARVIDVSLILYAEHDYNASTFTARVIASTLSDMHSALTGGVGALKGPLHGGANEAAMRMLAEIRDDIGPDNDPDKIRAWMHKAFEEKRKLMGFGHRVYKNGDHRASILLEHGKAIAKGEEAKKLFELGEHVQRIMEEEKGIYPNVDFPCGMTYYTMGIPVPQYTPIFVAARITGWAAHVMEQHDNNRLIRPKASYVGPNVRKWNA